MPVPALRWEPGDLAQLTPFICVAATAYTLCAVLGFFAPFWLCMRCVFRFTMARERLEVDAVGGRYRLTRQVDGVKSAACNWLGRLLLGGL
jgi:hypothetical protein